MGSVFKKTVTRPIPAGATVENGKAKWTPRGRKRPIEAEVAEAPDGRLTVRVETGNYYAKYRDQDNVVQVVSTGTRDRDVAALKLGELMRQVERIRAGVATVAEMGVARHRNTMIERHIADYAGTLTGRHGALTRRYLERLAAALGWKSLGDLERDGLLLWLAAEERRGRSARSRLGFQRAATSFGNWLVEVKRLSENPFARLPVPNLKADRRRPRRALTPDELRRLVEAAASAPERPQERASEGAARSACRPAERLSGAARGALYAFLAGTGLRLNEVRQLKVADLDLDTRRPGIRLRASTTKNRDDAYLPLRTDLVDLLRPIVGGRPADGPVFPIPADLIKRFHADCRRAGIARLDDSKRRVDLHALRLTFGTMLAVAGVPLTTAQKLMRHGDPRLTANVYTDARLLDLHGAVEALPPLPVSARVAPSVAPSVAPTGGNREQSETSPSISDAVADVA